MGFTTFVTVHFNHSAMLGFMNEYVVLESNKYKTMLLSTLHLSEIKFGPKSF
jgi:hypothetical protein